MTPPAAVRSQRHQTSTAAVRLEWVRLSGVAHPATLLGCCLVLMLHWPARQALLSTGLACCQSKPLIGGQHRQRRRLLSWLLYDAVLRQHCARQVHVSRLGVGSQHQHLHQKHMPSSRLV